MVPEKPPSAASDRKPSSRPASSSLANIKSKPAPNANYLPKTTFHLNLQISNLLTFQPSNVRTFQPSPFHPRRLPRQQHPPNHHNRHAGHDGQRRAWAVRAPIE